MKASARHAFLLRAEPWVVWILGACALASVPILQGQASIIWDALNHQIYLGWISQHERFDRDLFAAGWQSYQYPYLYWPAYKLAASGASGVTAGIVLALLQSLAIPPLWLVARSLCPGRTVADAAWRFLGVAFALSGALTLSLVETTSNDVLAGIPLVWAVALSLMAFETTDEPRRGARLVVVSGFLAGVSVAFKLSNGPLALVLPALWLAAPAPLRASALRVVAGCVAIGAGFLLAYAWWGWQMWHQFGNPLYPFYDSAFEGIRAWSGWRRP